MTKLDYISLSLIFSSTIIIILGVIKIHTYPGKIAKARKHPQEKAIEVTSLLGLLVFPLWMFALVWAYSGAVLGVLYAGEDEAPLKQAAEEVDDKSPQPVEKEIEKEVEKER
jgi:hypothetical protein